MTEPRRFKQKAGQLILENEELRSQLREAEETLNAIKNGEADAIVVSGINGDKIFSLTSAETPYRIILENMDEGAVVVTGKGLILYSNLRFSELLATPPEKVTGSNIKRFIADADKVQFRKLLQSGQKVRSRGIVSAITGNGERMHLQLSFVALTPDVSGDICIIASDLTTIREQQENLEKLVDKRTCELRAANKQLSGDLAKLENNRKALELSSKKYRLLYIKMREAEAKYKELVENSRSMIIRQDPLGKIVFFNEYAQEIFGYTEDELTGKSPIGTIVPEIESTGRKLDQMLSDIYADPDKFKVNINENIKKNGDRIWVEWHNKATFDKEGNRTGHIAIGIDITDRIRAEKSLKDSEEKLEIALESGHIGIWERNLQNDEVSWDERMERIFGIDRGTFGGNNEAFEDLIDEEDLAHFRKAIDQSLETGSLAETVFRTRSEKDNSKYISTQAVVNKDSAGTPVSITGICFDVTGMKKGAENAIVRLNEELLRSNKELENFAYIASHDLQEPLRMVSSFTQMLEQRYGDKLDKDAREYIRFAVDGAKRMYDLLNGLLAYSRIQTKGHKFVKVNMSEVFEKVINNLSLRIQEKNAIITKSSLPVIFADENQMIQLLQNLFENGIKFSQGNPKIQLSSGAENNQFLFSVKDEGMGIDPQYFERIFKIFQRLMPKEDFEGTGIGLAICRRIVERHEGKIWVESEPGKGSTFYFTIPK